MTPASLADIHLRAFNQSRPWSEEEFARLLADPKTLLLHTANAFVLVQYVLDEAEILTLATDPEVQRQGLATKLLQNLNQACLDKGIIRLFLEVSAENLPAIALYQKGGFTQTGQRAGYYRLKSGQRVDALLLEKRLKAD